MISLAEIRLTNWQDAKASEQTNRAFDLVKRALGQGVTRSELALALSTTSTPGTSTTGAFVIVDTIAQLFGLGTSSLAFVKSVGDYFRFTQDTLTVDGITVAGSSVAGYQWLRLLIPNLSWYAPTAWYVSPATGSDENDGGTSGAPLKTLAEQGRRTRGRTLSSAYTVNLLDDAPDTDYMQVHLDPFLTLAPGAGVIATLQGISTVVATSAALSAVTTLNPATNTPNAANVGADWSAFVGKIARLQGTSGATMKAAVIESTSGNVVTFGLQYQSGGTLTGFTAGQIVDVISSTKCGGLSAQGGNVNGTVAWKEIQVNPTGVANLLGGENNITALFCEFRGTAGTLVKSSTFTPSCCGFVTRDVSASGTVTALACGLINMHFQLNSNTTGRHHFQECGGSNANITANTGTCLRISGNYHMFNLQSGRAGFICGPEAEIVFAQFYYGAGNNAGSAGLALPFDCRVFYGSLPTMDAGLGVYYDGDGTGLLTLGTSLPFAGGLGVGLPLVPATMTALPGAVQSAKLAAMVGI